MKTAGGMALSPQLLASLPREKLLALALLKERGIDWQQALAPERQQANLSTYQNDPVAFANEVLGVQPWAKQQAIMRSVAQHKRTTVRACHYSGKTWAAGVLAHWFTRCFSPSLVISTAPTDRQVKEVLWKEIRRHSLPAPGIMNRQDMTVSTTQRAFGFTTSEPEKFQGWHEANILVIVDEASGVEEPIYEAIEGVLTGPNARLLLIGNPNNPDGTFFQSFRVPLFPGEGRFHISAFEVPEHLLPPGWPQEMAELWGEDSPMYQVRVLGEFPPQGEDSLISLKWAEDAQERELPDEPAQPVQIGVDVARFGSDESVCLARRGRSVVASDAWRGCDTVASAGRVGLLARNSGASLVAVDDPGIGGGVTDRLRELKRDGGLKAEVQAVNVGERARDDEKFYNRRSELFWGLRERFQQGDISIPKDDILLSQLTALRYSYTPRGQIKVESKDDLRKRRPQGAKWTSPDRADALMLCFASAANRWVPVSAAGEAVPVKLPGFGAGR